MTSKSSCEIQLSSQDRSVHSKGALDRRRLSFGDRQIAGAKASPKANSAKGAGSTYRPDRAQGKTDIEAKSLIAVPGALAR
jgi:hypothetical protein